MRGVIEIPQDEIELTFARSSGPGGQHVNTSDTKVTLRWDVTASPSLPDDIKARFLVLYAGRLTKDGILVMTSEGRRSRQRNIESIMKRLADMLVVASHPPKPRTPTRPSRASVERRLSEKARRAAKKSQRRPPVPE
jgi:ribosome-associated protein